MPWSLLVIAGLLEVVWAVGLKYAEGFTKPIPSLVTLTALGLSLFLLASATKTLPMGTAYVVWVGIGALGTAIAGIVLWGEPLSVVRVLLIAMLLGAVLGLKLTAPSSA